MRKKLDINIKKKKKKKTYHYCNINYSPRKDE